MPATAQCTVSWRRRDGAQLPEDSGNALGMADTWICLHAVAVGDVAGLLARFAELKRKAEARTGMRISQKPDGIPLSRGQSFH